MNIKLKLDLLPKSTVARAEELKRMAGLGWHSKELEKLTESLDRTASLMKFNIGDTFEKSPREISLLLAGVDSALSSITTADTYIDTELERDLQTPVFPDPGPNPIWETNRQLGELTGTVTQLVEVARQQAELTQAIRKASDLALESSIQSSGQAKSATDLARKGLRLTFWTLIIAMLRFFSRFASRYTKTVTTGVQCLAITKSRIAPLTDRIRSTLETEQVLPSAAYAAVLGR